MTRTVFGWTLVLAAGTVLAAAPASAQIGTPVDRECVCVDDLQERIFRDLGMATRHARIGVVLGEREEAGGRQGVRAERVPQGSPAHRAGLRTGDIIVALDGHGLGAEPAATLIERLADVPPGDTVEVTFVRGADERTARVATEEGGLIQALGDGVRLQIPAMRRAARDAMESMDGARIHAPGMDILFRHGRRDGLELAAVNPELGTYFGTDSGVLVTAVDEDASLDLRPGDVILAIGDRDVRDPAHVRSILASYRDDETITLRVVRERRTIEVTAGR